MTEEVGVEVQMNAEVVSTSQGCQNTPAGESSCNKRCETQWRWFWG